MKDRKEYWNVDYFNYWKKRVEEANLKQKDSTSDIVKNDKPTFSDSDYFSTIDLLEIKPDSNVLELGCGFGRSIPYLYKITNKILGIDISKEMVEDAKSNFGHLKGVNFLVSEAEKTNFDNDFFDNIICFAVFDTLYQEDTLREMNRILKNGGKVLITGKNDNYFDDDELAMVAEINARKKEEPNYFTDINLFFDKLDRFGFELVKSRFFKRRGDFIINNFVEQIPKYFYEFLIVLKKVSDHEQINFKVSSLFSKTYARKKK